MKHLNFSSKTLFTLENGSRMAREWLENGSASSRKLFTLLFVLLLGIGQMWGAGTTVKYTASSASAVSTTGTAPTGSSASLSTTGNWNSPWIQCTNGKGATLTLS